MSRLQPFGLRHPDQPAAGRSGSRVRSLERAALYEHIHGTRQTVRDRSLKPQLRKHETGEMLRTPSALAGRPPAQ